MRANGIAVGVRCHDAGRTLEATLGSIRRQTRAPDELVIVDHESADIYTQQVLSLNRGNGIRVIPVTGSDAAARNAAVWATSAEYLVVLDADTEIANDYLEQSSACLDREPAAGFVIAGAAATTDVASWLARVPPHAASMFRRSAWRAAGGFDESAGELHLLDFWLTLACHQRAAPILADLAAPSGGGAPTRTRVDPLSIQQLCTKHQATLCPHAEDLIIEHERALLEMRDRSAATDADRHQRQTELGDLHRELDETLRALQRFGEARVDFGDLRRLTPLSPVWGLDRGKPLDRYYIEAFLERHRADVRGRVLEVKDPAYTVAFGGDRVTRSDVVDIDGANPCATVFADLTAGTLPADTYDCFILTQTLGVIYDVRAALRTAYRVLKPGGVLLCTLPASGRISYEGAALDGDFWRFTEASARRLFAEVMPSGDFDVAGFGNVLAATAFLYGLAPHELTTDELEHADPFFPVVYGVRAVKRTSDDRP